MLTSNAVEVYCDGACSNNPGAGGWGAVLIWNGIVKEMSGYEARTTNNRMELCAAINSLKAIKVGANVNVTVYTDSKYVKNGITCWMTNWKSTGWRGGKIKNVDLWLELDAVSNALNVEWRWVKGHAGNKYNEMADRLARMAVSQQQRKEVT